MYDQKSPKVNLEIGYRSKDGNEETTIVRGTSTPKSRFPQNKYEKIYEVATVKIADIVKIHKSTCPHDYEDTV